MKVLADQYLDYLGELMPGEFELTTYNPDEGSPGNAGDYDALLVRTVTKVDAESLSRAGRLKFIGSATAGFDHVDVDHLHQLGITFTRSEGCNANAVAEYVITVLYSWGQLRNENPKRLKVGVIGCGHTGGALIGYLEKLGIGYVPFDPPKAAREPSFQSSSLGELLSSDILSFHVPLTSSGPDATFHMCDENWLKNEFKMVINASRGGVLNEQVLLKAYEAGVIGDYVLDVWEGEPVFTDQMAVNAFIATPHIAGYSREAKWRATEIVIRKLCQFFDVDYEKPVFEETPEREELSIEEGISFTDFLWKNHKINDYDEKLRELIGFPDNEKATKFAELRSNTKPRFEFRTIAGEYSGKIKLPDQVKIFING